MKATFSITTFIIFLVCIPAFGQDFLDIETKIYHEYIEKMSGLPLGGEEADYKKYSLGIEKEIADKYGLSPEEVDRITDEAKTSLSDFEWEVFYALSNRLKSIPPSSAKKDYDKAWDEVANKYGITRGVLADIMYKGTQSMLSGRAGLSRWERSIFNDFDARIRALPESATQQQCEDVREYIANKYGIDQNILDKIIQKVFVSNFKN